MVKGFDRGAGLRVCRELTDGQLAWRNAALNREQRTAVLAVMSGRHGRCPFVLFGACAQRYMHLCVGLRVCARVYVRMCLRVLN